MKLDFDPKMISESKSQVYETIIDYKFSENIDQNIKKQINKNTNKNIQIIEAYRATIKRMGSMFIN